MRNCPESFRRVPPDAPIDDRRGGQCPPCMSTKFARAKAEHLAACQANFSGKRIKSTKSHQTCPIVIWTSWTRGVSREGTVRAKTAAAATGPPSPPLKARVLRPSPRAVSSPATTLGELPPAHAPGQVPGPSQSAHLFGEDLPKIIVIGHRGEDRTIGGQGQGGQGRPLHLKPVDKLRGQVLGVRGRPAVPENQHPSPGLERPGPAARPRQPPQGPVLSGRGASVRWIR